jgi:hypothetical protein
MQIYLIKITLKNCARIVFLKREVQATSIRIIEKEILLMEILPEYYINWDGTSRKLIN